MAGTVRRSRWCRTCRRRLPRDSSMATFTVRVWTMVLGLGVGRVTSAPRPPVVASGVRTSRPTNTPNANSAMPVRIAATGLNGSLGIGPPARSVLPYRAARRAEPRTPMRRRAPAAGEPRRGSHPVAAAGAVAVRGEDRLAARDTVDRWRHVGRLRGAGCRGNRLGRGNQLGCYGNVGGVTDDGGEPGGRVHRGGSSSVASPGSGAGIRRPRLRRGGVGSFGRQRRLRDD